MGVLSTYRRLLGNGPLSRLLLGEFISSVGNILLSIPPAAPRLVEGPEIARKLA